MESTQTSLVLKNDHFQISDWLKACCPRAVTQLSPNLEKYAAEAEWTAGVLSAGTAQLTQCASYGSLQPVPGPFPASTQLLRTADCSCLSCWKRVLNSPQSKSQTCTCSARKQTGHSLQFVLCQLAQAHLFAGHSSNQIHFKNIFQGKTLEMQTLCTPPGSGPFPQRFTYLSLSIHRPEPVTSTQQVDFTSLHQSGSFQTNWASGYKSFSFCKISVFYS